MASTESSKNHGPSHVGQGYFSCRIDQTVSAEFTCKINSTGILLLNVRGFNCFLPIAVKAVKSKLKPGLIGTERPETRVNPYERATTR